MKGSIWYIQTFSEGLDCQLRSEELYKTWRSRGIPEVRIVTTSNSAPSDALKGTKPIPESEDGQTIGRHEEIPPVTVLSMVVVPSTDGLIFANVVELNDWDAFQTACQRPKLFPNGRD